ncbi:MAG: alpha/beta hydrolase [Saprospirales bacterium]|nr:MAG: alpha/beta hydrolase [Saprospirales bacterium]
MENKRAGVISIFTSMMVWFCLSAIISEANGQELTGTRVDTLSLQVESEGYVLDGLVLRCPELIGPRPALIYLVGSGEGSTMKSNSSLVRYFLEESFLSEGYVLVYFDKRGLGDSEGLWYNASFEDRALDAANVAAAVKDMSFVDKDNIFLIGHSQGGWIVQVALSMYPELFRAGVSMAGPTFGVRKQLINDYWSGYKCRGLDDDHALRKATKRVNRELFLISILGLRGNLKQLRIIRNFESSPYLESIEKPLLLMFAENDPLVSSEWCIDELHRIFPEGVPRYIEYYTAEGAEHFFKIAPKCFDGSLRDVPFSESSRKKIFQWIQSYSSGL